jgi:hypothetical protein
MSLRDDLDGGRKISPPPGFDPRTVQLLATRYLQKYLKVLRFASHMCDHVSRLHVSVVKVWVLDVA